MNSIKKHFRKFLISSRYVLYRYVLHGYYRPVKLYHGLEIQKVSDNAPSFFGYYNVSPENKKKEVIYIVPQTDGGVNLICKRNDGSDLLIGKTFAYNSQQGCMSQWGYLNDDKVYYNRYNELSDKYESVIYDTANECEEKILPLPIYSLSKQEDYALSLNFERLAVMRPDYGYFCREVKQLPPDDQDGIWEMTIPTGHIKLIISLQKLKDINPSETMEGAMHKVNHIDISPDGKRFMFLHRWVGPRGRYMRLITANRDGSDIYILNGDIMTSHSYWIDSQRIISFCHTSRYGNSYVIFEDRTQNIELISEKLPHFDGHPSTIESGKWVVTDSYPTLDRMSRLYLFNTESDELLCLGRFFQPRQFLGTERIDLHPKWNMDGTKIYFESGHKGHRDLYYLDVTPLVKKI